MTNDPATPEQKPVSRREAHTPATTEGAGSSSSVPEDAIAGPAAAAPPQRSRARRIAGLITKIVSWVVIGAAAALIIAFVLVPRVTGATPYTVLTGSMRPSMPPGTTVVVRPVEFDTIRVGDVITYQIASGKPEVVTHRVIAVNITPEGPRLETKGDANPAPDQNPIRPEQVRGKVWYWAPVVGYLSQGVQTDTRTWIARGIGIALIGYAGYLVVSAVRGRARRRAEEHAAEEHTIEEHTTEEHSAEEHDAETPR
ncbi:signal peptidase I [Mycetocola tolaasinivorans]|uniref:Signal peptidase I n=1 Tax=Mycetocola tolaasinivorans TaxID=76635 RepID=A0A3L7A2R3_9MICO|nr:signal peptidase I [Mycetocola tolaasinivorans]RLP74529.1 signal peptidase I [Mycetocola tolaasinivorans]